VVELGEMEMEAEEGAGRAEDERCVLGWTHAGCDVAGSRLSCVCVVASILLVRPLFIAPYITRALTTRADIPRPQYQLASLYPILPALVAIPFSFRRTSTVSTLRVERRK
jgi:hypothetical protein